MIDLTWNQKFDRIKQLDPDAQVVQKGSKFSISSAVKIGGHTASEGFGEFRSLDVLADTPMEAVDTWWDEGVDMAMSTLYLVYGSNRYRFDAFDDGWRSIDDDTAKQMLKNRQEANEFRRQSAADEVELEKNGVVVDLSKYSNYKKVDFENSSLDDLGRLDLEKIDSSGYYRSDEPATPRSALGAVGRSLLTGAKWAGIALLTAMVWATWESSKKDK